MKAVTDCFKTLFIGLDINESIFGLIKGVHQPPQQQRYEELPREDEEHRDGEGGGVQDPHISQEEPDNIGGDVDAVTPHVVPFDPVGEYLIP